MAHEHVYTGRVKCTVATVSTVSAADRFSSLPRVRIGSDFLAVLKVDGGGHGAPATTREKERVLEMLVRPFLCI